MAEALLVGALTEEAVSGLSNAIILAMKKTWHFKSQLNKMKNSVESMRPIFKVMEQLNNKLDLPKEETAMFINLLNRADNLVPKCEHIKFNLWKRYNHASKLDDLNTEFQNFIQIQLQVQSARDGKQMWAEMRDKNEVAVVEKACASGWCSGAPLLKGDVIGFDDQVRDLKAMVLKDCPDDDCSVVVVSAAGGSGKTTFVQLFCNDPEIQGRFGRNIFFVTVSQSYDVKVIVAKLLSQPPSYTNNEDAIQQWGKFLRENKSEILLVLDDIWCDSVINDFKFKLPGYKVLVTSRTIFPQFKKYQLKALNNQDAAHLFRRSAFSETGNEHSNIPNDLVDKLVTCCKNHPLLLSVTGSCLKGEHVANWEYMLEQLSDERMSYLNLHETIQCCLEKNLYFFDKEPKLKQCYLDLGLFPEDQKIAATALMDIWVHLYKHDEGGRASFNILTKLLSRHLVTLFPKRKHVPLIANYCEEESVMQHDMLRDLAIKLSNQESKEDRETLIIRPDGQDHHLLPQTVNARVLSICTDERVPLTWNEFQAPEVEVFVLNFMSKIHPLPQFMHKMEKLKVLIITNYGYYFSEIQNFPAPQYLSHLTRIRLDHVSISSISTKILMLENLQKLSLIMCKIGNSFNEGVPNKLPRLFEIEIESCDDLVTFPETLCNLVCLKKLSIINCHELTSLSKEFGKLSNLEVLRISSCSKLTALPESVRNLKKLKILDISHCLNMRELPQHIGELGSLHTIDAMCCTGLHDLPKSIKDFDKLEVVCDDETSCLWSDFKNVKVKVVEEDRLDAFFKILPRGHA